MKIVTDTGPIIGLAKINMTHLLKQFADEVLIPPMVYRELFGKIGPESSEIDIALSSFIQTTELFQIDNSLHRLVMDLDEGEKQAIALAHSQMNDTLLLMDDRAGREVANKLNIPVIGLLGLLIESKKKGFIKNFGTTVTELRQNGYWLSDDIILIAKKLV